MSVRGDILDSVATELATITTANSYANTVMDDPGILRNVPHSNKIPIIKTNPTLCLDDEGIDDILGRGSGNTVLASMTCQIRAYVQNPDRDTPPTDQIGMIIADLKKLIDKPISLGAQVRYAEWVDLENAMITDNQAIVVLTLVVVYWYDGDSP